MSSAKPTIVFVHGAWHPPALYTSLTDPLKDLGYTVLAPALPSVDGDMDSFDEDVALVRKDIQSALDNNHDVALLMHSYGGVVSSAAVQGLSKTDRGSNSAGVVKMIYLCAFAMPEGASLIDGLGGKPADWFAVSANGKSFTVPDPTPRFYNDVDPAVAQKMVATLGSHAVGSFKSKQTYAAWQHIDSAYIVCDKDEAIPPPAQVGMSQQEGNKFRRIVHLDAGHSPFLSKPKETTEAVRKCLGESI